MKVFRICFILIMILQSKMILASDDYTNYLVVSENVNIRGAPSINSNIIRQVSFPVILQIYEIVGSGNYHNGIYDRWARVSSDNSEWINMFFITSFPFVVSSRNEYYSGPDDFTTIIIKNFYYDRQNLFFEVEKNLNPYYHNNKYNILAYYEIQNIRILDNPWIRLFNFCESFIYDVRRANPNIQQTWRIEIDNPTIYLNYGIRVGMNWTTIEEILGTAYNTQNITWYSKNGYIYSYAAMYIGHGHRVKFFVVENEVVKIEYLIEK